MFYIIMHNPQEDGSLLEEWAGEKNLRVCRVRLYAGDELPEAEAGDRVALMGGAMNVDDFAVYPWLRAEREWLRRIIGEGLPVLGICLGAQLLTVALGGRVIPAAAREIGFWEVSRIDTGDDYSLIGGLPERFTVLQWHGDACELPDGARLLAVSAGCGCQAFSYGQRVLGIQFHPDYTAGLLEYNLEAFAEALEREGRYIQSREEILAGRPLLARSREYLRTLLDALFID